MRARAWSTIGSPPIVECARCDESCCSGRVLCTRDAVHRGDDAGHCDDDAKPCDGGVGHCSDEVVQFDHVTVHCPDETRLTSCDAVH